MKKSFELRQERAKLIETLESLTASAQTEKRAMTDEENSKFDTITSEIEAMDKNIERAEKLEALNKQKASEEARKREEAGESRYAKEKELHREEKEVRSKFSLAKAIAESASGGNYTGAEAEVIAEARQEANKNGIAYRGMPLPTWAVSKPNEKRAAIAATGNDSIPINAGRFIDDMHEYTRLMQLGAQKIDVTNGNLTMGRGSDGSGTWEGETDAHAESGYAIDGLTLTAKRVAAYTDTTLQFLTQSPYAAEQKVRQDLLLATSRAVDRVGIQGASGGDNPVGIINMSGVNAVVIGANGGALTRAKVLEMKQAQIEAKAFHDNANFLTSARTYVGAEQLTKDSGSGRFILEEGKLEGNPIFWSNYVPTDLDKGSSTGVCSALILGDFSKLIIANFGVIDILTDPYSKRSTGMIQVSMNSFWDIQAEHESAFTVLKDLTT